MNIWTPRTKILEPKSAIASAPIGLQGFFKLEAVRPDGRRRLLADWFPNLITDVGLNVIGTQSGWLSTCRVGTGSATPNNSDTGLQSQIAETQTVQSSVQAAQGSAPYYGSVTRTYRFAAGVAAGNLAEIGIASDLLSGPSDILFSRALILDGSGDPTTITVLSDEVLDATYQLRMYPPTSDVTHTVNISGTDYDVIERASRVTDQNAWATGGGFLGGFASGTAYDGAIGAVTTTPSGTTSAATSQTNATYGNNNLYRDATIVWGLPQGNFGGGIAAIGTVMGAAGGGGGCMQFDFNPNIAKTSSTILTLVFRHTWARGSI